MSNNFGKDKINFALQLYIISMKCRYFDFDATTIENFQIPIHFDARL